MGFEKKSRMKLNYISFSIIILIILIAVFSSYYLFVQFKTGDFVYSNKTDMVGEIKGVSLPLNYLVQWQDGSLTKESLLGSGLEKLSEGEAMKALKKDNFKALDFYPWLDKETGIIFGESDEENATGSQIVPIFGGKGNFILRIGDKDCKPSYFCGDWDECKAIYDLDSLLSGELISGVQYRYCKDYSKCMIDFIDSRKCDARIPIKIKSVELEGIEYIEVYDEDDVLISRLEFDETSKLNIQMLFDSRNYAFHCFDGILNQGEDEVDCVYEGDECPLCEYGVSMLKENYPAILILFISLSALCFFVFIWYLFLVFGGLRDY